MTLELVDLTCAGYGFHLRFWSIVKAYREDFLEAFNHENRGYGVNVWGKENDEYVTLELVTMNQDTILSLAMNVAEYMGLDLGLS
jgi:hypothetical protein